MVRQNEIKDARHLAEGPSVSSDEPPGLLA